MVKTVIVQLIRQWLTAIWYLHNMYNLKENVTWFGDRNKFKIIQ